MKKIILFILAILLFNTTYAQDAPPEMFKFQAVITNKKGKPINNQMVGVEISIYQNAINGILVYSEIFNPMTSSNGIINLEIGNGVPTFGMFSDILWGTGTFFMEVKVDVKGGSNYVSIGASQLLSVPYSLFSKQAISLAGPDDIDDQNEIQTLSLEGNVLRLTDGGEVTLPENTGNFVFYYADKDADGFGDPWNVVYADVSPSGYVTNPDDCNDDDASINPAATEIPEDGIDQNCDGIELYLDKDADGFTSDVDCDDLDATVYPGAEEVCDGKDNDCDGGVDNDCVIDDCQGLLISFIQYSLDNCESGFDLQCWSESPNFNLISFCLDMTCIIELSSTLPPDIVEWTVEDIADYFISNCGAVDEDSDGFAPAEGDCDDFDPTIYPGALEICDDGIDQDCDGSDKLCNDEDNDGFVDINFGGDDCDDTNPSVNPEGFEECDGLDNDCDGLVDNIGEHNDDNIYYRDEDGDGWGSDNNIVYSCVAVDGYVLGISGDCDDLDPTVYPLAEELCDGIDNNCDGLIDEVCDVDGDGFTVADGDCDDNDPTVYPGAEELCGDNIDNDCNGAVDETCDLDWDSDGFSINDGDCDDENPDVNPGQVEILYNGLDDDCDPSTLDEDDTALREILYITPTEIIMPTNSNSSVYIVLNLPAPTGGLNVFISSDNPDITVPSNVYIPTGLDNAVFNVLSGPVPTFGTVTCEAETETNPWDVTVTVLQDPNDDNDGDGFTIGDGDCDDNDNTVYPGAPEIWYDSIDQNCDGLSDFDQDQDGFDSADYGGSDCDDTLPNVNPGEVEECGDGLDNDCDGFVDNNCVTDSDNDGVTSDLDSDDNDPFVCIDSDVDGCDDCSSGTFNPANDGVDTDGDGICDLTDPDVDGDGFTPADGDCNDLNASIYPGAVEVCGDGIDNDCDGIDPDCEIFLVQPDFTWCASPLLPCEGYEYEITCDINPPGAAPFQDTPAVYLQDSATFELIQVPQVVFNSATSLTFTIPCDTGLPGLELGVTYNIVVVNPGGTSGIAPSSLTTCEIPPP